MSEEQAQQTINQEEHYEFEVKEEKENVIFGRKEVKGIVVSTGGTPPKSYVLAQLSSKYKVPETHIDLRYVVNKPGRKISEFFALVYNKPIKEEPKQEESQEQ